MTQTESTQIEDNNGAAAEVIGEGGAVELAVASGDFSIDEGDGMVNLSLLLSPKKARRLALLLLQAAEAQEGDDE